MAVFATKWDFLFAWVLIGVDRSTGVFSGSEPTPGQQMVCVWSDMDLATEALHVESWDLQKIKVRDLLALLPSGIGVIVDPERPTGMTATASYVAQLKPYVAAFPAGSEVRLAAWNLPEATRDLVIRAVSDSDQVKELRVFAYTVDDSPLLGCLTYVAASGADTASIASSIDTALSESGEPADLGVPAVSVLGLADLPAEVRAGLGDAHVIHRRSSRFWRR